MVGSNLPSTPFETGVLDSFRRVKVVSPAGAYSSVYLRKLASVALPTTSTGLVTSALFVGAVIAAFGNVPSATLARTVNPPLPVMLLALAWIVVLPSAKPLAIPTGEIAAMVGPVLDQPTMPVKFWLVPSLKMPVAVKACSSPTRIIGAAGSTTIDVKPVRLMVPMDT